MEHAQLAPRHCTGPGVEIGAFKTPIPGIAPVYVDRFAVYAGEATGAEYRGDACELPYHDSSLRYVASSHVLEHVANPLAALAEWFRVLCHRGIIYMVVPDRRRTFDRARPLTSVAHMLDDHWRGVTQCDGTHIDDFAFGVDWREFSPGTGAEGEAGARQALADTYRRAVAAGEEINIHFHTFEPSTAIELVATGNRELLWPGRIEVVQTIESFPGSNPNGFLLVAQVFKHAGPRWRAMWSRKGLRADAQRF